MKKTSTIAVSILMLCSILLATAGIANAGNMDYTMTEHWGVVEPTIDGEWSSADEWSDAMPRNMSTDATFRFKVWGDTFTMLWIVEYFGDTTDDAGDIWQICLDNLNGGGTAPQAGDFKIEITGHTTLAAYEGNGAGWDVIADASEITWADSISASPKNSTPHWILEISDIKTDGSITVGDAPPTGLRVAAYDADTDTWVSWAPDGSADVPDEWGVVDNYDSNPYVPEGFSIAVIVLLSSIAVATGVYFTRKRPKAVITQAL